MSVLKAWGAIAVIAVLIAAVCCGELLLEPLTSNSSEQIAAARRDIEGSLGLQIAASGSVEFHTFPRPHISATAIAVTDPSGAMSLDIPSATATLALGPLLRGRIVVEDVRVTDPTGIFDAAAIATRWRNSGILADGGAWSDRLPRKLVISSGVIQVRSDVPGASGLVTDLHMAISGAPAGAVLLNGRGNWHGGDAELAGQFDTMRNFVRAEPTTGFLKLKSRDLSFSLTGTLAAGWRGRFKGVVAASTPSMPGVLRLAGLPVLGTAGIQHASFTGSAETTDEGVAISNARLILNTTALEGTVALQRNGGLVGTLATDVLDFTPFLNGMPSPLDVDGRWNAEAFGLSPAALHDVDLRISANRVELGRFRAEDAALSALCRDGRMELSLGEARAYGGLIKARLLTSAVKTDAQVRLDASASRVELDQMAELLNTRPGQVAGSATAHLTVEGRGGTFRSLVASMKGQGQIGIRQGQASGLFSLDRLLGTKSDQVLAHANLMATTFDLATASGDISEGIATIRDGAIEAADDRFVLSGGASLVDRSYSLHAAKPSVGEAGGSGASRRVPLPPRSGFADSVAARSSLDRVPGLPRAADDGDGGYFP